MFTITKEFSFSASHRLSHLPEGHPCFRLHGHNYVVRVELSGELDGRGFVYDYRNLRLLKIWIDEVLDHRHLNNVMECEADRRGWSKDSMRPTAELLASWIFTVAAQLMPEAPISAVSVSETPKTWATYRPNGGHHA